MEILDAHDRPCGTGEAGRVVITDLQNFASPLIRYDIGDYAEVGAPCGCGRGLPTLSRVLGRERNRVIKPDGTRNWPRVHFARHDAVAPVRQHQLIQHSLEEVEFRVVTDQALTPVQEAGLKAIVQDALGHPFNIRLAQHRTRLPRAPNGRFEEFICRVR